MPSQAKVYRVLVASPSDVAVARETVRDVILDWTVQDGLRRGIVLVPLLWEEQAVPEQGERPQAVLNRQFVDKADLAIGVFGTKVGTPTGAAESGTIEEIERLLASGRRVSLYFSREPVDARTLNREEFDRLTAIEKKYQSTGIVWYYQSNTDLASTLRQHLSGQVDALESSSGSEVSEQTIPPTAQQDEDSSEGDASLEMAGDEARAFDLLAGGQYEEGLNRLVEEATGELLPEEERDVRAFGMFYAYLFGDVTDGIKDLRLRAGSSEPTVGELYWLGRALIHAEQFAEAFPILQRANGLVRTNDRYATSIAESLANVLAQLERTPEAVALLQREAVTAADSATRARLLKRAGKLLSSQSPVDFFNASLMYELSLEADPTDVDTRFDLAYLYSEHDQNDLAYLHYLKRLERKGDDPSGKNNAGASARSLGLPLTSVRYYQDAERNGSVLAVANQAWALLTAGFGEEARACIARGRETGEIEPHLEKASAALVEELESEKSLEEQLLTAAKVERKWRLQRATALLTAPKAASELTGVYMGSPAVVTLNISAAGVVTGTFFHTEKQAQITGRLIGSVAEFSWQTLPDETAPPVATPPSLLGFVRPRIISGSGVLLFDQDGAHGYIVVGSNPEFSANPSSRQYWNLRRLTLPSST